MPLNNPTNIPIASSSVLGGIKVGSGLLINTSGVLSATGSTTLPFYNVKTDFGAKGDGATDDTAAIQNAFDTVNGGTLIFPPGTYLRGNLTVTNKSGILYQGYGANLVINAANSAIMMFGTCKDLTWEGFNITGSGNDADYHQGFANNSGQNYSNITIKNCRIQNVSIGIDINADLGGTVDDIYILNNTLNNIVGTTSGHGYGIHFANCTNSLIFGNKINAAQRHSIYHAKGGRGNRIINNTITNHRDGVATGAYYPAITIYRSDSVLCMGNIISGFNDGGIGVMSDNDSPPGFNCYNIDVINNMLINQHNTTPAILVGEPRTVPNYITGDVRVINNHIICDTINVPNASIEFLNGKNIDIIGNYIYKYNQSGTVSGIELNGDSAYGTGSSSFDNIRIEDNVFSFQGNISEVRGILVGPAFLSSSVINVTMKNNRLLDRSGGSYNLIFLEASNSNPGLILDSARLEKWAGTAPSGSVINYKKGDIVWNSDPDAGEPIGWVCVVAGNPGTWKAFGTISS
jgi:hypothetical protein